MYTNPGTSSKWTPVSPPPPDGPVSPSLPTRRWFSSDTKQERCDWMDKLNQVLLDLHTWTPPTEAHSQPPEARSTSSSLRESLL